MSKITPLMTSLHEGHSAEERLKCIDSMLYNCKDTKDTILQAFWWYRTYNKFRICENCQEWNKNKATDGACYCNNWHNFTGPEFYCGDWVKRGTGEVKP